VLASQLYQSLIDGGARKETGIEGAIPRRSRGCITRKEQERCRLEGAGHAAGEQIEDVTPSWKELKRSRHRGSCRSNHRRGSRRGKSRSLTGGATPSEQRRSGSGLTLMWETPTGEDGVTCGRSTENKTNHFFINQWHLCVIIPQLHE
jgi:hypothetical protein